MSYYIGIDSGGTKTEFILSDPNGHIVSRLIDGGCNPLDVGISAVNNTILSNVKKLGASVNGDVAAIYAGIAGVNHVELGLEELLENEFPGVKARIEDDRRIVVSSMLGHVDGCGMICGTGSSLSIIISDQPIRQVGGLGYLIDTGGSGYELGQAGLKQAFRYLDGRAEYTVLPELMEKALGKKLGSSMAEIYKGGRPFIASLAHTVFEGMEMGDETCRKIVEESAYKLSELTFAAERYFNGEFPVVMTGGIFHAYPEYVKLVREKASPKAKMIMASVPPVYGAIVEAMWQDGKSAGDTVRDNFMRDCSRFAAAG